MKASATPRKLKQIKVIAYNVHLKSHKDPTATKSKKYYLTATFPAKKPPSRKKSSLQNFNS